MNKCCENCIGDREQAFTCSDEGYKCPCHSQEKPEETTTGWEERFDETFDLDSLDEGLQFNVKHFIAKERTQAKKEALDPVHNVLYKFDCSSRPASELFDEITKALLPEQESTK